MVNLANIQSTIVHHPVNQKVARHYQQFCFLRFAAIADMISVHTHKHTRPTERTLCIVLFQDPNPERENSGILDHTHANRAALPGSSNEMLALFRFFSIGPQRPGQQQQHLVFNNSPLAPHNEHKHQAPANQIFCCSLLFL